MSDKICSKKVTCNSKFQTLSPKLDLDNIKNDLEAAKQPISQLKKSSLEKNGADLQKKNFFASERAL